MNGLGGMSHSIVGQRRKKIYLISEDVASDRISQLIKNNFPDMDSEFYNMFGGHIIDHARRWNDDPDLKIVFYLINPSTLMQAESIAKVRETRKDIFLVGYCQTDNNSPKHQYATGLRLLKLGSCNLVLSYDIDTGRSMVIAPEETYYGLAVRDFQKTLEKLVEIVKSRSSLTFTRSTVVPGQPVDWNSEVVPESLRKVVNYCIKNGAYKPINGATAGHFAVKVNDRTFLTSARKTNFNELDKVGLVKVETEGLDKVVAYGRKPSVGGQSQRIIFSEHEGMDCVCHFHSPKKENSLVPVVSQEPNECGSHQCGQRTSDGLKEFGNLKAVYLDRHGPNIVFNSAIDAQEVIDFIEQNFDLKHKTDEFSENS